MHLLNSVVELVTQRCHLLSSTRNTYNSTGRETHRLKHRGDRARPSNEARIALRVRDKLSPRDKNEARTLSQRDNFSAATMSFKTGSIKM